LIVGGQINFDFPVLEHVLVHVESFDQALSVLKVGVAEPFHAASSLVTLTREPDTFDVEMSKELHDCFGVHVV